jgi:hypothetical protein
MISNSFSRTFGRFFVCSMTLAAVVSCGTLSAATIMIDDFVTPQSVAVTASSPTGSSIVAASEVLGGERDMKLALTSGFTSLSLSSNPFGGEFLVHDSGATVRGISSIIWDGPDGSDNIDFGGLGGVDIGTGNTAFVLAGVVADLSGTISLIVYDAGDAAGDTWSQADYTLPTSILSPTDLVIPFSDFTFHGAGGAADLTNVGAIEFQIENITTGSLDVILDSVSVVPEPSSLWLSLVGWFSLLLIKRR